MKLQNRYIYLITASLILLSFGVTVFLYWQQNQSPINQVQTPETYNATPESAQIIINEENLTPEELTTIPIYINSTTPLKNFTLNIEFNNNLLEFDSITIPNTSPFDNILDRELINDEDPQYTLKMTAEKTSGTANQIGTDIHIADFKVIPHIDEEQSETTAYITINSDTTIFTATEDVYEPTTNPLFTISNETTDPDQTTLTLEDKDLTLNKLTSLDIDLDTPEIINSVDVVLTYNPSYIEITRLEESDDFEYYPETIYNETDQQIIIRAENEEGIDGSLGSILVASLNITPIKVTSSTDISFEFTIDSTDDSNVTNEQGEDILDKTIDRSYVISETSSEIDCFNPCDFSFQCPGDTECQEINEQTICIDLGCSDKSECECPEGGPDGYTSSNTGGSTASLSETTTTTDLFPATVDASPTPAPQKPNLPDAGTQDITLIFLIIGITILSTGSFLYLKK